MVCTTCTCTIIATFGYYRSQIIVVLEREYSKPAEYHQTLIKNRLQETLPDAIHKIWQKNKDLWESIPIDLDKWPFCSLTFLTHSLHHLASLYKEGSICDEEIFKRFSFRTDVQPESHRFADLWPFASKSKFAASFCRSGFKYGVRSLNTQHFHSYCTYKTVYLWIKVTLTLEQLTWISMGIFLSRYCTNTNMLYS